MRVGCVRPRLAVVAEPAERELRVRPALLNRLQKLDRIGNHRVVLAVLVRLAEGDERDTGRVVGEKPVVDSAVLLGGLLKRLERLGNDGIVNWLAQSDERSCDERGGPRLAAGRFERPVLFLSRLEEVVGLVDARLNVFWIGANLRLGKSRGDDRDSGGES